MDNGLPFHGTSRVDMFSWSVNVGNKTQKNDRRCEWCCKHCANWMPFLRPPRPSLGGLERMGFIGGFGCVPKRNQNRNHKAAKIAPLSPRSKKTSCCFLWSFLFSFQPMRAQTTLFFNIHGQQVKEHVLALNLMDLNGKQISKANH